MLTSVSNSVSSYVHSNINSSFNDTDIGMIKSLHVQCGAAAGLRAWMDHQVSHLEPKGEEVAPPLFLREKR